MEELLPLIGLKVPKETKLQIEKAIEQNWKDFK